MVQPGLSKIWKIIRPAADSRIGLMVLDIIASWGRNMDDVAIGQFR